ncbi:vegetative cell wall protein gp1-like [Choloepus didactylus]|uniref:vegetative cell wall protein gp1-like n=1 Tax=Choloepus didactylus TaxID=27675 RepID=UPI0018A12636|nr:vegetative cell wall protein gp1-like [Choloepus didactylus]
MTGPPPATPVPPLHTPLPTPSPPAPAPRGPAGLEPAGSWDRGRPPGPRLTLWGAGSPARASPAAGAAAVFMSLQAPRPPAAHSRPGPGRAGRLGVTGSPDSQGPASHRSGRSRAPHAHPPATPRAGCGKRGPGKACYAAAATSKPATRFM